MSILLEALRQKSHSDHASNNQATEAPTLAPAPVSAEGKMGRRAEDKLALIENDQNTSLESLLAPLNIQAPEHLSWQLKPTPVVPAVAEQLVAHDDNALTLLFPLEQEPLEPVTAPDPLALYSATESSNKEDTFVVKDFSIDTIDKQEPPVAEVADFTIESIEDIEKLLPIVTNVLAEQVAASDFVIESIDTRDKGDKDASLSLLFPEVATASISATASDVSRAPLIEPIVIQEENIIDDLADAYLQRANPETSHVNLGFLKQIEQEILSSENKHDAQDMIEISDHITMNAAKFQVTEKNQEQNAHRENHITSREPEVNSTEKKDAVVTLAELPNADKNPSSAKSYLELLSKKSEPTYVKAKKIALKREGINVKLLAGVMTLGSLALVAYYGWSVWEEDRDAFSSQMARYDMPISPVLDEPVAAPSLPIVKEEVTLETKDNLPVPIVGSDNHVSSPKVAAEKETITRKKPVQQQDYITTTIRPLPVVGYGYDAIEVTKSLPISLLLSNAWSSWHHGDVASAEKNYRQVLEKQATNRDALIGMLAVKQLQSGMTQEVQDIAQRLLELYPQDEELRHLVVNIQGGGAPREQQETKLKNQLQKEPNNASVLYQLGIFYASEKRWAEAQAAFFRSVTLDSGQPEYLANLAIAYDQLGKVSLAMSTYQRALDAVRLRPTTLNQDALRDRLHYLSTQVED